MRLIARVFVFVSSLFIILYGILPGFFRVEGDFIAFYVAGKNFLHGVDPILFYKFPDFQKLVDISGLSTRIFTIGGSTPASFLIDALIAVPPAGFSQFVLTSLNLAALVLLVHVSARLAKSPVKTAYLVFLSSSFALATNFSSGEPFIIVALFFAVAFFATSINAERATGAILGLVFPFEVFTAIPALLFLLAKKWRVFTYFLLMSLFLLLITYFVVGNSVIGYYLQHIFPFYFNGKVQNPFSISYQTGWSFFKRIFLLDPTLNPHPILVSRNAYVLAISLFKAIVVVPSGYFFYRGMEKNDARESFIAATFPIIFFSPTAEAFQLVLLAPAIICLGQAALEEQRPTVSRVFIVLYALACLPIYSLISRLLNIQTPFLLYERFFLLLAIYFFYLIFQLRLVPKHLAVVRMSVTAAIIAAVTVTLFIGDTTPEPTPAFPAVPALNGEKLAQAAFSPALYGDKLSFVTLDSNSRNYTIAGSPLSINDSPTSTVPADQDLSGNFYHISIDEDGKISATETIDKGESVVNFRNGLSKKSYRGKIGLVSRDGNFGAFIREGRLFVVDLQRKEFPVVDSANVLPFMITQYSFNSQKKSPYDPAGEIVLIIDSLDGANSIGVYHLSDHSLMTYRTLLHLSLVSADNDIFYMTSVDGDSTIVWSQRDNRPPTRMFEVHGTIIDISVVNHDLYFSSDFQRGLGNPTIYRYPLDD